MFMRTLTAGRGFFYALSNKSVVWDWTLKLYTFSLSVAATVAHFHCLLICYLYCTSIKVKGAFQASSLLPMGAWSSSLPLDVLAPRLICNAFRPAPLHYVAFASYCLCIASARLAPFFTLPSIHPPTSSPFSSLALLNLHPRHPSLSPVSGWCRSEGAWQWAVVQTRQYMAQ